MNRFQNNQRTGPTNQWAPSGPANQWTKAHLTDQRAQGDLANQWAQGNQMGQRVRGGSPTPRAYADTEQNPKGWVTWHKGPLKLNYPQELDNLMSSHDNAVVMFYKPGCPYCMELEPVYSALASDIHRTNLKPGSVPIVMAQINGSKWKDEINALRSGFLGDPVNKRGYPTILFKRSDGNAITWDPTVLRTGENIATLMADFYQDPGLIPFGNDLSKVMNNPDPEFLYFYNSGILSTPRTVLDLDGSFVSKHDGIKALNDLFWTNDTLRNAGSAFPVNEMDRPDMPVPSIWKDQRSYSQRDTHRWALEELLRLQGESRA